MTDFASLHVSGGSANPAPQADSTASGALALLRSQLIDTSKRSRLVNTRLDNHRSRKQLDIHDERSDEVFRRLYVQGRFMRFKGSAQGLESTGEDDEGPFYVPASGADSPAARHVDYWLQTSLTDEALHKCLLSLYRGAHSFEEEQGISVLYLALGFIKWYESASSDRARYAPLILLPVDLKRDSAKSWFKLEIRDQDLEANLSFGALLKADFGLTLPDLPEDSEWLPSDYYAQLEQALSSRQRWRLLPDAIQLGFYSFTKFLMYKDVGNINLEDEDSLLARMLTRGFEADSSALGGTGNLDARFPDPKDLRHILDADASQARIIDAARRGRSLVVQGPPGTGKSQTIANIIAAAVAEGKTVLFVAEKRAALDVVHARLGKCALGPVCLELHSNKVSKKHVYAELRRTLELGKPGEVAEEEYQKVAQVRDGLNRTSALLHAIDSLTGQTPYNISGYAVQAEAG